MRLMVYREAAKWWQIDDFFCRVSFDYGFRRSLDSCIFAWESGEIDELLLSWTSRLHSVGPKDAQHGPASGSGSHTTLGWVAIVSLIY